MAPQFGANRTKKLSFLVLLCGAHDVVNRSVDEHCRINIHNDICDGLRHCNTPSRSGGEGAEAEKARTPFGSKNKFVLDEFWNWNGVVIRLKVDLK